MKNFKLRLFASILAVGILFTACGKNPVDEQAENSNNTTAQEQQTGTRKIVDMSGREVEIPAEIKSVHATSPIGQDIMYTINPDKMAGWCSPLNNVEQHFINEKYHSLPVLGGNFGKNNKMNPEVVIEAAPDMILSIGKINDTAKTEADALQDQLGIPVILAESTAQNIDKCYEFLGDVLNEQETCAKLAAYCKDVIDTVNSNTAKLKDEDKVSVYYAENLDGLATDPSGSSHAMVLDMIGCKNVAEIESSGSGYGRADVSPEQILKWNPDMVIICPEKGHMEEGQISLYDKISSNDKGFWGDLTAVKEGNFYEVPVGPFNWFDRPPSINQILGLQWCGNLVYPEIYDYDMKEVTKNFFNLFFHYELTDGEYNEMLANSVRK